jgi:hypothetical protein
LSWFISKAIFTLLIRERIGERKRKQTTNQNKSIFAMKKKLAI